MDEIDSKRIKRLPAQVLLFERSDKERQINKLQSDQKQWRGNASDAGAISQMEALAKLERLQAHKTALDMEIATRKQSGIWDPRPIERAVIAKKGPVPPSLKPAKRESVDLPGEELPIKVMDNGYPRAWRPSDGPIHSTDPSKTITDVSRSTAKKEPD